MIRQVTEEAEQAGRPVLVLDTGDSLFPHVLPQTDAHGASRVKAHAIVQAMGAMGYAAMAVGPRDLSGGYDALLSASQQAGVRLLAANLQVSGSRRPFDRYEIIELGGLRVGLIGISTADHSVQVSEVFRLAGVSASDPVEAARAVVQEISDRTQLIIILGNLSEREAMAVGREVEGAHLLLTGGVGRLAMAEEMEQSLRYEPGSRGQFLIQLDLSLGQGNRLVDSRSRRGDSTAPQPNVVSRTHPLLEEIAPDPDVAALLSGPEQQTR